MAQSETLNVSSPAEGLSYPAAYLLQGYWDEYGDPRVGHLFLMSSLTPLLGILILWSLVVLYIGPRYMSTRSAFSLKPLLVVYNLALSLWNAYFLYKFLTLHRFGLDTLQMVKPPFDDVSPETLEQIALQHVYFLSRIIDLFDTIFFVLRKKDSQISGLHLYHHLTVPLIGWTHVRLVGNGRTIMFGAYLNSTVHTVMYAYYGLSALGPQIQPYLWWKRYITQLQILQFILLLSYGVYFALYSEGYPAFFANMVTFQAALYILLFGQFYLQTYKQKKKEKNSHTQLLVNESKGTKRIKTT